ncbi:type I-D CRISPR-associated protein Cas7/Csc2 [Chondrinema litorale]|uniref:type I-D CRISPR-associated protein Cas7/Csc2 n=1 Tax=Chondrinema litorale TaxID=2994555 RepID=UPI002542F186|nr:type I-D CRISPR-associated protein Cas7/Csc2 [Chondrinema litorale]UZR99841.1 type I-D CRISPR-associated protein Cas7/Csc2 [Chondrinema litorale]
MENIFNKISEQKYFINNLKTNQLGHIKVAILREVINPLIIRSTSPDEVLSYKMPSGKEVVEIPARKLKSREKLRGLKQTRVFNAISEDLRYNAIKKSEHLANINSLTFGDTVSGEAVGLPARAIYDWSYSIQEVIDVSDTLQHNALGESGTMHDEEKGGLRQSLFQVQYVMPGTLFPHFITLENTTPAMLFHVLSAVIYENRYGAQSTTTGANMKNHIIGIGFGRHEPALNSYLISKDWNNETEPNFTNVQQIIIEKMQAGYGAGYLDGSEITKTIVALWNKQDNTLEKAYADFQKLAHQFLKEIKVIKK